MKRRRDDANFSELSRNQYEYSNAAIETRVSAVDPAEYRAPRQRDSYGRADLDEWRAYTSAFE
jgi:hypothetical protein